MADKNKNSIPLNTENDTEFDWQDILYFKNLSTKEKLEHMEKMQKFFDKITPDSAKKKYAWLKEQGF
ncbi:MAG: hypothetical protein H7A33_04670 [Deltaproteobacteria bacterium]|nr:hypothetical protein [Deltaproteobacteria bacterium]